MSKIKKNKEEEAKVKLAVEKQQYLISLVLSPKWPPLPLPLS